MSLGLSAACWFVCTTVVGTSPAGVTVLPPGSIQPGGLVDDDGRAMVVLNVDNRASVDAPVAKPGRSPVLVHSKRGRVQSVPLGSEFSGMSLRTFLDGGELLLSGHRGPVINGYTARALDIVEIRGDEVRRHWGWNSRKDNPECRTECDAPIVSSDGRMWGYAGRTHETSTRVTFEFGRTRKPAAEGRIELVDLPNSDKGELPIWGHFWFLDTSGPVVLIPWSGGGYIVHFTDGASPHVVAVLQGSERWSFLWQGKERVLWAAHGGQLRAYNLWDLGVSGLPDAPFWELDAREGWEPHHHRGAVRVLGGPDGYRIEHLWREPWTSFEERHVSAWIPGSPPTGGIGIDVLVSPSGRHAVVLEKGPTPDDESATYLRRASLDYVPVRAPVEAASAGGEEEQAVPASKQQE